MRKHERLCLWQATVFVVLVVSSCISCSHVPASGGPSIDFTSVPEVNPGGPLVMGSIVGHVNGPHQGLKVVLYARSGRWYVQPYADKPFTAIKSDSTWSSPTHLGSHYAALLVQPDYVPPPLIDNLPAVGGGVVAISVTGGTPPLWQRLWFRLLAVLLATTAILAFYRWRMLVMAQQLNLRFEERLAERTRIAQELHDTLLQGLLSISMQLHVAMDQLPDGSAAQATLDRLNQSMRQVIEEGRNTIRGLRSSIQNPNDLINSFSQIFRELSADRVNFRMIVEGTSLPLHPAVRDEVYRIVREALVNAFRHSRARNITLHLEYSANRLRILVEDDGCGIDSQIWQSGHDRHWGLSGMRERAERIGGTLSLMSRAGAGTEVELQVPSHVAFEPAPPTLKTNWFGRFHHQQKETELTPK